MKDDEENYYNKIIKYIFSNILLTYNYIKQSNSFLNTVLSSSNGNVESCLIATRCPCNFPLQILPLDP